MKELFHNSKKHLHPAILFLSAFLTYVLTMPRTIQLGDNAEYITAAATLGIPHPSGYPLYAILGKLFSLLPVSTIAFRVNLLSAAAASFGLVVFYLVFLKVCAYYQRSNPGFDFSDSTQKLLALSVAWLLATAPLFWHQATTAQVYSLNFLFFILLFWLVLKFWESPRAKYLFWGSLLAGLGLTNHQMLVLLLPFFFAAVATVGFRSKLSVKFSMLGLFLLGMSVYFYLPVRSHMEPVYQWGNAGAGWGAFFDHVLRSDYADLGLSAGWSDKAMYAYDFLLAAGGQFGLLVLWSLFGLGALYRAEKRLLLLCLGLLLGNVGGIILLRNVGYNEVGGLIFTKYCLTSFAILAALVGLGAVEIFRMFARVFKRIAAFPQLPALLILIVVALAYSVTFVGSNWKDSSFLQDYSFAMLDSLPRNSVLLVSLEGEATDSVNFALLYQQAVKKLRPDVTLIGLPQIFKSGNGEDLKRIMRTGIIADQRKALVAYALSEIQFLGRPIFTTFLVETLDPQNRWISYSNGLAYWLTTDISRVEPQAPKPDLLSVSDERLLNQNVFGQDLLAQYYYAQASQLIQNGEFARSQALYIKAIQTDDIPTGFDTFAYRAHREVFLGQVKD